MLPFISRVCIPLRRSIRWVSVLGVTVSYVRRNRMGSVCKRKAREAAADAEFKKIQLTIFDVELDNGGAFDARTMHTCTR